MTNSRTAANDLRAKIHELFAQVMSNLDPQLDKLMGSGCGIVDDHERREGYAAAKMFLAAFLKDEAERFSPGSYAEKSIMNNYSKFL